VPDECGAVCERLKAVYALDVVRPPPLTRFFAVSAALHALGVGLLAVASHLSWPTPPIPIEIVMPKPKEVRPPPPAPAPKPAEKPRRAAAKGAEPRAARPGEGGKPARPEDVPPPPTSDLKALAPDEANLVVLLSADKLRKSPYRADVEDLLRSLPDYNTLLVGTGLTLTGDFDALLIGTPNPLDGTVTFLAARYPDSPQVRALTRRKLPDFDHRVFRTIKEGLAVLALPEAAARLDAATRADLGADDSRTRWLAELEKFDRAARTAGAPAVMVSLADVQALLRFGGGLPTPATLALAVTADATPALRLKAVFKSEADAESMERGWPGVMQRYKSSTALLGLSTALDGMRLTRRGAEIEVAGHVPEPQFKLAMGWVRAAIPRQQFTPLPPEASQDVDGGAAPR
jgi:hypothetical protein